MAKEASGKRSLASIIHDFMKDALGICRVNCSSEDSFDSVIRRALGQIQLSLPLRGMGYNAQTTSFVEDLTSRLPSNELVSPDAAAALITELPGLLVFVIDEFDRVSPPQTAAFADFIKALSDRGASSTIVLVGVGQTIDQLISSHQSVERCLKQIPLQRMSDEELEEIIDKGLEESGFELAPKAAKDLIVASSQGFPHFTHLISQNRRTRGFGGQRADNAD